MRHSKIFAAALLAIAGGALAEPPTPSTAQNKFDPSKTYPLRAGSVVSDELNTVHWDGAKDEPVVLMIVGEGPVPNVRVDENGKPMGKNNF